MLIRTILCIVITVFLSACDQSPDQVYTQPVLSGKAYVLAATDHIAIVDLATTDLSRIKMDKKGLGLAIVNKQLYVLAEDGTLATLKNEKSATPGGTGINPSGTEQSLGPWQEGLPGCVAMIAGPDNNLWLLGKKELKQFVPGQGLGKSLPVEGEYSSLFFGEGADTVWLVSRTNSSATPFNLTTAKAGATIAKVGNSVHHGLAFAGASELWLAEGNEYMDGEAYGVGYADKAPAMPGGINVIDLKTGKQNDFIMVGGNTVDLAVNAAHDKVYAAVSQLPEYVEATLSLIDPKTRRTAAELRLCESCHKNANVTLKRGQARVLALAISWQEETP